MGAGLTKQARILTEAQIKGALATCSTHRNAARDRAMVLLSVKAGLRACEIAALTWPMVTDAQGALADEIALQNIASKGKRGGRVIPLNADLKAALATVERTTLPHQRVIAGERGPLSANAVAAWFVRLYRGLGFDGCSSHSGRRTFITRAARKVIEAGGSLRDVQELAGHSSLTETQRYIDGSASAKRKLVNLI